MSLFLALFALSGTFLDTVQGTLEMMQFKNFIAQFNKTYASNEEFKHRFLIFQRNMEEAKHLQREERGTAQYGVTKFSDLTDEEFLRCRLDHRAYFESQSFLRQVTEKDAPLKTCDWRKKGVISAAKNQGSCCSCWAFAAVGNIEAQWGIQGTAKNLSVQQLVDCCKSTCGCKGGYPWNAFMTVIKLGGLTGEDKYKYTGKKGTCKNNLKPEATIQDLVILERNETVICSHVSYKGTVTVAINQALLKQYIKGVIDPRPENCHHHKVDHVVLIVGFSRERKYWILKNSWGDNWGEKGFFRLRLGSNACGIAEYPVSAIVNTGTFKRHLCPP
ncbi:cathepsin W [Xenopus laevis]|uniref:Cathepsin W n=2 Tax=Xenopus laevis TaxID=8355 RepID=A0A310U7C6_XENLA|nr:cathepsin W [Xenopus laevis]OCT56372.1 hypothetical protein XELAEV_18000193mg [Xenopus laevis]